MTHPTNSDAYFVGGKRGGILINYPSQTTLFAARVKYHDGLCMALRRMRDAIKQRLSESTESSEYGYV